MPIVGSPNSNQEVSQPPATGAEFFDQHAERWSALYGTKAAFRDRMAIFSGTLTRLFPPPCRVLDFGCGAGNIAFTLAGLGYTVHGTDAAATMLSLANHERKKNSLENVTFSLMDASSIGFEASSFDAVVCSSVLEYVDNDMTLLDSLTRVLCRGGYLLISVPHTASVLGKVEDATQSIARLGNHPGRGYLPYMLRRYNRDTFLKTLRTVGLDPVQATYFEVPLLGRIGIPISRIRFMGLLLFVAARKTRGTSIGAHHAVGSERHDRPRPLRLRSVSRKRLWEGVPMSIRASLGHILRVAKPSLLLGRRFRKARRLVVDAEGWSRECCQAYQLRELRRVCDLAYQKSNFYRSEFDRVGFKPDDLRCVSDVSGLPFIDKQTVLEHLPRMCTVDVQRSNVDSVSTGGTSGMPLHFYVDANRSSIEFAHLVTAWARVGYRLVDPQAVFRGDVVPANRRGLRHAYDPILRRHYYSNFHMTDENMRQYLAHVATLGSCFLLVYPSSANALARFIERTGVSAPKNIRGLLVGSENVYPEDREKVETIFGARYFSWYGHSEKTILAAECEHSTDYHVFPTYGYFELLDEAGSPVTTPGERGEIVGTGFINSVMPFIRYRTGDYATYVGERCAACGRAHTIINDVSGHRTQEVLVAADGSLISWTAINMHDSTFHCVQQLQFVQRAPGAATLRVVPTPGFKGEDVERIRKRLGSKLDGRVTFDIKIVDRIALTPTGKSIYVDQQIDINRSWRRGDGNG